MLYYVFNPHFERVGILDSYVSAVWEERYSGDGRLALTLILTPHIAEVLKVDYRLWKPGKNTSMIITSVTIDDELNAIVVRGRPALKRLGQRVALEPSKTSNAEAKMKGAVQANMRGLSYLQIEELQGLTETCDIDIFGRELDRAIMEVALNSSLGAYVYFNPREGYDELRVFRGRDMTQGDDRILLKEAFGNLPGMRIADDVSLFKNVAHVFGEDRDGTQRIVTVGDAQGIERREMFIHAGIRPRTSEGENINSPSYIARLEAIGVEALTERLRRQSFVVHLGEGVQPDFRMGDIIMCISERFNISLNLRVTGMREVIENNTIKIEALFGDGVPTVFDEWRAKL